jgi:hypothetical protein
VRGTALVPFPIHAFHKNIAEYGVLKTEVSPSTFIFAAKDVICRAPVAPTVKNET